MQQLVYCRGGQTEAAAHHRPQRRRSVWAVWPCPAALPDDAAPVGLCAVCFWLAVSTGRRADWPAVVAGEKGACMHRCTLGTPLKGSLHGQRGGRGTDQQQLAAPRIIALSPYFNYQMISTSTWLN